MTYPEAVFLRHSSRTYDPVLSDEDSQIIDRLVDRLPKRHFGSSMAGVSRIDCAEGVQPPGTYGFIGGSRHYLVVHTAGAVNRLTYIDCGMIAELMALDATRVGLGSCLMTGSLRDTSFARAAGLSGADSLLLVSPIGYTRSPRLTEVLIGKMSRSGSRMPLSRFVFADSAMTIPWQPGPGDAGLCHAIEGLGKAPSALNRQPWRVVVADDHIEIHNSESDSNSWISMGCAVTNYCAMVGIRSDLLTLAGSPEHPVIIAPRPA